MAAGFLETHEDFVCPTKEEVINDPLKSFEAVSKVRFGIIVGCKEIHDLFKKGKFHLSGSQARLFDALKTITTKPIGENERLLPKFFFMSHFVGQYGQSLLADLLKDDTVNEILPFLRQDLDFLEMADHFVRSETPYLEARDGLNKAIRTKQTASLEEWIQNAPQDKSWRPLLLAIVRCTVMTERIKKGDFAKKIFSVSQNSPFLRFPSIVQAISFCNSEINIWNALSQSTCLRERNLHSLTQKLLEGEFKITREGIPESETKLAVGMSISLATSVFTGVFLMQPLKLLLSNPSEMGISFLPTMPEDHLLEVMGAVKGRWYTCPNGHPYFITECGRANQEFTCECGSRIGGKKHVLIADNKELESPEDQSQKGHILGDPFRRPLQTVPERNIPPLSLLFTRLLLHSILFVGAHTNPASRTYFQALIHNEKVDDPAEFFFSHLLVDLRSLAHMMSIHYERAALLGNLLAQHIFSLGERNEEIPEFGDDIFLASKEERNKWEETFHKAVVAPFLETASQEADEVSQKAQKGENSLQTELLDPSKDTNSLFCHRSLVSIERFSQHFHSNQEELGPQYPILSLFLEYEPLLRHVQYLPILIKLQEKALEAFNGRLGPKDLSKMTVAEAREKLDSSSLLPLAEFDDLFRKFSLLFREIRYLVNQHLPAPFRLLEEHLNQKISTQSTYLALFPFSPLPFLI